jgi:hypothetical protein
MVDENQSKDPLGVIVEDSDPVRRARAHYELGLRARQRDDLDRAEWHLREAWDLDPTDEAPLEVLRGLGISATSGEEKPAPWWKRLWARSGR